MEAVLRFVPGLPDELGRIISKSLEKVSDSLHELVREDIADLNRRLTLMESKGILPDARREIDELRERVRELERKPNG